MSRPSSNNYDMPLEPPRLHRDRCIDCNRSSNEVTMIGSRCTQCTNRHNAELAAARTAANRNRNDGRRRRTKSRSRRSKRRSRKSRGKTIRRKSLTRTKRFNLNHKRSMRKSRRRRRKH